MTAAHAARKRWLLKTRTRIFASHDDRDEKGRKYARRLRMAIEAAWELPYHLRWDQMP